LVWVGEGFEKLEVRSRIREAMQGLKDLFLAVGVGVSYKSLRMDA